VSTDSTELLPIEGYLMLNPPTRFLSPHDNTHFPWRSIWRNKALKWLSGVACIRRIESQWTVFYSIVRPQVLFEILSSTV
jgi:hypothetical protein